MPPGCCLGVWVVSAGLWLEVVPQMSVLILIALKHFQLVFKKLVFEGIPKWPACDDFQVSFAALGEIMGTFLNFLG